MRDPLTFIQSTIDAYYLISFRNSPISLFFLATDSIIDDLISIFVPESNFMCTICVMIYLNFCHIFTIQMNCSELFVGMGTFSIKDRRLMPIFEDQLNRTW